jgi:hypothetical protein
VNGVCSIPLPYNVLRQAYGVQEHIGGLLLIGCKAEKGALSSLPFVGAVRRMPHIVRRDAYFVRALRLRAVQGVNYHEKNQAVVSRSKIFSYGTIFENKKIRIAITGH